MWSINVMDSIIQGQRIVYRGYRKQFLGWEKEIKNKKTFNKF